MKRKFTPTLVLAVMAFLLSLDAYPQMFQLKDLHLKEFKCSSADTGKSVLTQKSPVLAGTLSFIVPGLGLGQKYNGQEGKFLRHCLISLGCMFFYFVSGGTLSEVPLWGTEGINFALGIVLLAYAGNRVWSVVDAIVSANNINKQVKLQKYRSSIIERPKLGFELDGNNQLKFKAIPNL